MAKVSSTTWPSQSRIKPSNELFSLSEAARSRPYRGGKLSKHTRNVLREMQDIAPVFTYMLVLGFPMRK